MGATLVSNKLYDVLNLFDMFASAASLYLCPAAFGLLQPDRNVRTNFQILAKKWRNASHQLIVAHASAAMHIFAPGVTRGYGSTDTSTRFWAGGYQGTKSKNSYLRICDSALGQ